MKNKLTMFSFFLLLAQSSFAAQPLLFSHSVPKLPVVKKNKNVSPNAQTQFGVSNLTSAPQLEIINGGEGYGSSNPLLTGATISKGQTLLFDLIPTQDALQGVYLFKEILVHDAQGKTTTACSVHIFTNTEAQTSGRAPYTRLINSSNQYHCSFDWSVVTNAHMPYGNSIIKVEEGADKTVSPTYQVHIKNELPDAKIHIKQLSNKLLQIKPTLNEYVIAPNQSAKFQIKGNYSDVKELVYYGDVMGERELTLVLSSEDKQGNQKAECYFNMSDAWSDSIPPEKALQPYASKAVSDSHQCNLQQVGNVINLSIK